MQRAENSFSNRGQVFLALLRRTEVHLSMLANSRTSKGTLSKNTGAVGFGGAAEGLCSDIPNQEVLLPCFCRLDLTL